MRVQALEEAWIVEAIDKNNKPDEESARKTVLTRMASLPEDKPSDASGCYYLRKVEVRAVLDEPEWCCSANDPFYGLLGPRRAWIVRERVQGVGSGRDHRPALLSSKAIEELVAWMEKVSTARKGVFKLLTDDDARSLWAALLSRVVKDDILSYVSEKPQRLSPNARRTLRKLGQRLGNKFQVSQGQPVN